MKTSPRQLEHARHYRERYPDRVQASQRKHRLENPEKMAGYARETSARQRFGGNRHVVLERDNFTCQLCGMTDTNHRQQFNRSITVDHKDGQGRYSPTKNHTLENLWVLCLRCHGRKDVKRRKADISYGENHPKHKLSLLQVHEIKRRLSKGEGCKAIGIDLCIPRSTVSNIKHGRCWNKPDALLEEYKL